ncbi:hypothetical protein RNO50_17165, partial [Escherichia coli]|nr:hypothetical protein [Escherichia coli]
MKPTTLLLIFTFFAMPGIVYAESPFSSLQSAKEKTTVLQDLGNDSNLLIVFYVQIMPDDFVMQLHR